MATAKVLSRRSFILSSASVALLGARTSTSATSELGMAKFVTAGPPGSVMDIICRKLSEVLSGEYAKTVVVENRPGAAVQIASTLVKNAPSDGGTFLLTPLPSMYRYPNTYKRLPYDPNTDFLSVCSVAEMDLALAVGPEVPSDITSLQAFFAWVKKDPKRTSFGSPAVGATTHFIGVMAGREAGIDMQHVGYKGPTPSRLSHVELANSSSLCNVDRLRAFRKSWQVSFVG